MKKNGKRLALLVLAAALLAAVLAGTALAAENGKVTVTGVLRDNSDKLQITGTAENVQKLLVAAYDA